MSLHSNKARWSDVEDGGKAKREMIRQRMRRIGTKRCDEGRRGEGVHGTKQCRHSSTAGFPQLPGHCGKQSQRVTEGDRKNMWPNVI